MAVAAAPPVAAQTPAPTTAFVLANGITTIRNMDFRKPLIDFPAITGPELLRLKARAARGEILRPRIYTSGDWQLDSTKSVDENLRQS